MKLYEITSALAKVERLLEQDDIDSNLTLELDELTLERDAKCEGICALIKNLEADADAYKIESARLKEKQQATEKRIEWLRSYLSQWLKEGKYSFGVHKVSWRASEAVVQEYPVSIDARWLKPQEPKVDIAGIKNELKAGREVPGWKLETRKNIQIK